MTYKQHIHYLTKITDAKNTNKHKDIMFNLN